MISHDLLGAQQLQSTHLSENIPWGKVIVTVIIVTGDSKPSISIPFKEQITIDHIFLDVWDQQEAPYYVLYATAQFLTLLYRTWKPDQFGEIIFPPKNC
uniref:Uncharacterized protein n=1 Tax=Helianthus annuus TaxID=4232 RepID=A0A251V4I4_HELAN